jgi:hypothetical protein
MTKFVASSLPALESISLQMVSCAKGIDGLAEVGVCAAAKGSAMEWNAANVSMYEQVPHASKARLFSYVLANAKKAAVLGLLRQLNSVRPYRLQRELLISDSARSDRGQMVAIAAQNEDALQAQC